MRRGCPRHPRGRVKPEIELFDSGDIVLLHELIADGTLDPAQARLAALPADQLAANCIRALRSRSSATLTVVNSQRSTYSIRRESASHNVSINCALAELRGFEPRTSLRCVRGRLTIRQRFEGRGCRFGNLGEPTRNCRYPRFDRTRPKHLARFGQGTTGVSRLADPDRPFQSRGWFRPGSRPHTP